jgi:NDP-sugar pyrophosphorylase family protein
MLTRALVLTAGLGTRLRPLTLVRAKPAVPVAGEPLVRRIIGWLAAEGVTDVVLNLHYLPQTITSRVGDGSDLGVRVRYSWEGREALGSAGGPRHALSILGADAFFLVNGDTLTDLSLEPLARAHADSGALVTMALMPNVEPERYGGVRLDKDGRVTGFASRGFSAVGSHHFVGVQAVQAETFASLPDDTPLNSLGNVYDKWIAAKPGGIRGHVCSAGFCDIGTTHDYIATSRTFATGGQRADRSIVWDNVTIGEGAVLDECIVTDDVNVPAGMRFERAILYNDRGGVRTVPI